VQRVTVPRRLTQLALFALTGQWLYVGWTRCPFGVPFVNCMSCPLGDCWGTWLQLWFLWLLGASALVVGRAFCGWACPMGLVEDALGAAPRPRFVRVFLLRPSVRAARTLLDRWLKPLKYVSLALAVWLVVSTNYGPARSYPYVVRSTEAFGLESVRVAIALGAPHYALRLWVLGAALVIGALVLRGWCRYLCPLGALLGLANKISLLRVRREESACNACGRYPRECLQSTVPGTADCVVCGDCVQGCGAGAVTYGVREGPPRPAANERMIDPL